MTQNLNMSIIDRQCSYETDQYLKEYSSVNSSGLSLAGAHKFAQAVSALKVILKCFDKIFRNK